MFMFRVLVNLLTFQESDVPTEKDEYSLNIVLPYLMVSCVLGEFLRAYSFAQEKARGFQIARVHAIFALDINKKGFYTKPNDQTSPNTFS